jgi:hypothetical protein
MLRDQQERPTGRSREKFLCVVLLLMALTGGQAKGQIYPDPKWTKAFESRLEALAKSHTRVFVSDCNLPPTRPLGLQARRRSAQTGTSPLSARASLEKAILTIPIGSSTGTLQLFKDGDVYNGSGVVYDAKGAVLIDPGGGEWSQRRLQSIADQLSKFRFALMQPEDAIHLMSQPSSNSCVVSDKQTDALPEWPRPTP